MDVANPHVAPKALREVLLHAAQDDRVELQVLVSLLHHFKVIALAMGLPVDKITPYMELADAVQEVVEANGQTGGMGHAKCQAGHR